MPPSFARTRGRAEGQNTSTAEETRHIHSLTFGRSLLSFLVFTFHCKSLGSQAYLMISSIHLLMFSRLSFVSNDKLRTAVSTRAPAISAAMAVQAFNGTAILLIVIHFSFSAALIHDATAAPAFFFCWGVKIVTVTVTSCGRGARTHGDVLNVHTGADVNVHTGRGVGVLGWREEGGRRSA